ncbi:benzoate-CoA ligase family protein [Kutzneria kofuensis]|uniref:Benzoate-CoA ligase family protein n=1 Tax=Kutzneria kofuensis TaxID=103725 RepID=A0A7W9KM92_9PSEU|nr:benzoate-CoA ligase family protein [Kutzneria kofuensis]MBB5895168.1 benzoate-CoA ligase family protein [Kutzneria kofuensis]
MPDRFNAAEYLVDRHLECGHTAVVTGRRTLSYAELAEQVHRVAAGLRELGVRPEERVVLSMADDVEMLSAVLGAMYLGAVPVPVSTMLTPVELATLLADSRSRVLLASVEFATACQAAVELAPEVEIVVLDGETDFAPRQGVAVSQWHDLVDAGALETPYRTWADSPALWLYTSGTTGQPKAAMHRHESIRAVGTYYGNGVLELNPEDRCLSVSKLFFAYGLGNSCFMPLAAGAVALLERSRSTPELIAGRAAADRATVLFGVPTFYAATLASAVPDDAFSTVRQGVSAGEALPAVLFEKFRARFGVEILDGIGSTEALHIFLSNRPGEAVAGTSGVPVPGYQVEIRDEAGNLADTGDLLVNGPSTATGYWCRNDITREVFQGRWLRTGDTYRRNADGTYTYLGRSNDMLKAGGVWVSPFEVENRLLEHPDVEEVAVVSATDESGLQKPVACVVPALGHKVDEDALITWCRDGLASYKRPRAVVEVTEMPKTATGKIRRNVLRDIVKDVLIDDRVDR